MNVYMIRLRERYEAHQVFIIAANTKDEAEFWVKERLDTMPWRPGKSWSDMLLEYSLKYPNELVLESSRDWRDRSVTELENVYFNGTETKLISYF